MMNDNFRPSRKKSQLAGSCGDFARDFALASPTGGTSTKGLPEEPAQICLISVPQLAFHRRAVPSAEAVTSCWPPDSKLIFQIGQDVL
jgi:hypothetical protein